jgi:hypothetical protein
MGTKSSPAVAGDLAAAKRSFGEWRRSRRGRERIPDALWRMAAEAASIHGLTSTARRLRLNSARLKDHLQTLARDRASGSAPGFLELPWPGAALVPECILEAEDRSGRKLRIQLKGPATAQAASLGRMLWTGEE